MSSPARPDPIRFQLKPPFSIGGKSLGGLSCTCGAGANGVIKSTLGRHRPTTEDIRRATGDTVGGTMLSQVQSVIRKDYGVVTELHVGSNVATPGYLGNQLHGGRGFEGQGNTRVTLGTKFSSSETAKVNHAAWFNEGRGWRVVRGVWVPDDVLVYDPLADGRRNLDEAPSWWPWDLALDWFAALRPWGDNDPRQLGRKGVYSLIFPDTEPHVHLAKGAVKSSPFPDRTRAKCAENRQVNIRTDPSANSRIIGGLRNGELFEGWQYVRNGGKVPGSSSTRWVGDHDGSMWVHDSGLSHVGGAT